MFNSIRTYNYLNDFIQLINLYYKYEYRVIPTTYYRFDDLLSVYDDEILRYGAYERIGNLSGYKWIKIYYFPVAFSQQAIPHTTPNQYNVTEPTETQCVFPRINFTPTMLDFVTFSLLNHDVENIYQVSAFEESYIGHEVPIYKIILKTQGFKIDETTFQISREYVYCEIFDKIYEPKVYNQLIEITVELQKLLPILTNKKEMSSGLLPYEEV